MRAALVSDIHANLAAFEAVLTHAQAPAPLDAVWCMGDSVGYGPRPSQVIARLRELDARWVAGNHERAATGTMSTEDFNPDAAAAAEWTRSQLSDDERAFLDALPEVITEGDFTQVHGTLRDPIWEYLLSESVCAAHLGLQTTRVSLVGHTHAPALGVLEASGRCGLYRVEDRDAITITQYEKLVFNPGSVGQPRDGDPRAAYAIYDSDAGTITQHRVDYDISETQKLMTEEGLPLWLIQRLARGR